MLGNEEVGRVKDAKIERIEFEPNRIRELHRKAQYPETREAAIKELTTLMANCSETDLSFTIQILHDPN